MLIPFIFGKQSCAFAAGPRFHSIYANLEDWKFGNRETSVYVNEHIFKFFIFWSCSLLPYSHCYSAFMTWRHWLRFSRFLSSPGDTVSNLDIEYEKCFVQSTFLRLCLLTVIFKLSSLYVTFPWHVFGSFFFLNVTS